MPWHRLSDYAYFYEYTCVALSEGLFASSTEAPNSLPQQQNQRTQSC
jgi:hypothetical protein